MEKELHTEVKAELEKNSQIETRGRMSKDDIQPPSAQWLEYIAAGQSGPDVITRFVDGEVRIYEVTVERVEDND